MDSRFRWNDEEKVGMMKEGSLFSRAWDPMVLVGAHQGDPGKAAEPLACRRMSVRLCR